MKLDGFDGGGGETLLSGGKRRHNHGMKLLASNPKQQIWPTPFSRDDTRVGSSGRSRPGLSGLAMSHPMCGTNVTAYVGQTAEMHCCLARLDRELSVKWSLFIQWLNRGIFIGCSCARTIPNTKTNVSVNP